MAGKYVYVRMNKTKAGQLGQWKEAKRIEAVTTYLSLGNLAEVSRLIGVPYETLKGWKISPWWEELTKQIRSEDEQVLDGKLTKVIDKALENLADRIENGEFIYDQKTGQMKRAPAKIRDLNVAFNNLLDKRQLIRKQPTKIVEQSGTAVQLQNLANSFASFVKQNTKPEIPFIEGDTVVLQEDGSYALHEERKT